MCFGMNILNILSLFNFCIVLHDFYLFFLYSMENHERSDIRLSTVVALEALSEY